MVEVNLIASCLIFVKSSHLSKDEQMLYNFDFQMIILLSYVSYYEFMNHLVEDLNSFINIILLSLTDRLYQLMLMKNLLKSNKNLESHCNSNFLNVNTILTLVQDYQLHFNQLNRLYCIKRQNSLIK